MTFSASFRLIPVPVERAALAHHLVARARSLAAQSCGQIDARVTGLPVRELGAGWVAGPVPPQESGAKTTGDAPVASAG